MDSDAQVHRVCRVPGFGMRHLRDPGFLTPANFKVNGTQSQRAGFEE
jgi:hypothetical protein